jgi:hypothetical protein
MPRTKPYTSKGIRRKGCIRCNARAEYQWQICSDHRIFRPLCPRCDIELNMWLLRWMNLPNWEVLLIEYTKRVKEETGYDGTEYVAGCLAQTSAAEILDEHRKVCKRLVDTYYSNDEHRENSINALMGLIRYIAFGEAPVAPWTK